MSNLDTDPDVLLAQVLNQLDAGANASALTMGHNELLARIVNAVSDGPDVSNLRLSETELLAALLNAVGGSGSNLTSSRGQLLAAINNVLSDGADLSPLTTSEGALFDAAFRLVGDGGGGADRRVTSTGAIRVTTAGDTRIIQMGAAATDPNFASVVLLLGFEGVDGSTTFTDASAAPHTMTAVGNAQIDTGQFKFGAASLQLDGTGDYASSPASDDWAFGAGEFTVEAWCRFADTGSHAVVGQWSSTTANSAWVMLLNATTLRFRTYDSGLTLHDVTYTGSYSSNIWYHLAFDRTVAGDARLYVNGVNVAKVTGFTHTFNTSSDLLRIGSYPSSSAYDVNGWVDELRITKGVARYASDAGFAVPTAAFPRA